jgi:hypothetical protein
MRLAIRMMWSPDLNPPSSGQPEKPDSFWILMQVAVGEIGAEGHEVFGFDVVSPAASARADVGSFVSQTLVLSRFDWDVVRARVEEVLAQCDTCVSWQDAIRRLSPTLRYADADD